MGDDENQKALIGGAIIASSICLHVLLNKRTISMSRNLYTITGNEFDMSKSRFSLLLGMIAAAAYIQLNQSSLFEGDSVGQGLSIPGFIISGLLIGTGAHFAYAGFETQAFTYLPNFNKPTIIAILLMFGGAAGAVYTKSKNPDPMQWFFGSADLGIDIDQQKGCNVVLIGSGVVFLLYVLYQKFQNGICFDKLIEMIVSAMCGGLYCLGIAYSGLAKKTQVQSFFDFNNWQPQTGLAVFIAIVLNIILFYILNDKYSPSWDSSPESNGRLYTGSVLFGLGWGFTGLCIGPVIAVSATCVPNILLLLFPSILLGYELERIWNRIN